MLEMVQPSPPVPPFAVPLKNSKWEDFATKYLECETQTEAARAIGTDESYAAQEARRLLNIPEVRARIKYLEEEQRRKALITEGSITEELAIIAFSSLDDYITGQLVTEPIIRVKDNVNPNQLRAISEIEVTDSASGVRKVKFKLHSKTAALQMAIDLKGYGAKNKAVITNKKSDETQADGIEKNGKESAEEILKAMGLKVA